MWTTFSGGPGARVLRDCGGGNEGGGRRYGAVLGAPASREMSIVSEGEEGARSPGTSRGPYPQLSWEEPSASLPLTCQSSSHNLFSAEHPKVSFCLFSIIFILH